MAYEVMIDQTEDNAQTIKDEVYMNLPIKTANKIIQVYLEEMSGDNLYEAEDALKTVTEIISRVLNQESKPGDADDWHNFAVDVARKDLYDLSCDILECGLLIFPKNIDLLADYLQYGTSCGRIEKCKNYYKVLSKIPKVRWGWRGYSFSVSYLTYLWERSDSEKEIERLQSEMLSLARQFRENLSHDEESYRCEADIYKLLHNKTKEEEILRLALEELKIAPKCALRLADLLFERGDYEDALANIQRGLRDAMQTQSAINEGYLYYLSGLSKMAMAQRNSLEIKEELVLDIYSDFDISLRQEHRAAYINTMKSKTIMLISKSGINVPDRFEELCYLVS